MGEELGAEYARSLKALGAKSPGSKQMVETFHPMPAKSLVTTDPSRYVKEATEALNAAKAEAEAAADFKKLGEIVKVYYMKTTKI